MVPFMFRIAPWPMGPNGLVRYQFICTSATVGLLLAWKVTASSTMVSEFAGNTTSTKGETPPE